MITLTSISGRRQSATASGVEREPGETTACRRPPRASSSTKAEASAVLPLVGSMVGSLWRLTPLCRGISRQVHLEAVRLQRLLVNLDAEPRPLRQVQHSLAQLALDRGDRRREKALRSEAVGKAMNAGRRLIQRLSNLSRRGNPDRAIERTGDIGGQNLGNLDR